MKDKKIEKEYIDTGFGFPVLIQDAPMVQVRGIWALNINYAHFANTVLKMLALKPSRLTGDELKFIRLSFEMKLEAFAKRFYVSHPAVLKWENKKDKSTNMNWATEKDIRLFIYNKLSDKEDLKNIYLQLEQEPINTVNKSEQIVIKNTEILYA